LIFYIGLHQVEHASGRLPRCMISVNRLKTRKSGFPVGEWIMDSGAFSQISQYGRFQMSIVQYAAEIIKWSAYGNMKAAVSQDYMCEPFILKRTGLTVKEHQRLTIGNYLGIASYVGSAAYVMPVLQGFAPQEYVDHCRQYGSLLGNGQWVGVGSVCKRNSSSHLIEEVLLAIHKERSDLKLHGFGLKLTALKSSIVRQLLFSCDSMAWSFAARRQGKDGNSIEEAMQYFAKIIKILLSQSTESTT
jgi:hypothetical protein